MPELIITERSSIEVAIVEFDRLGRHKFLSTYGFKRSRKYSLYLDGRYYDAKAVFGVAYGHENPIHGPLTWGEVSRGEKTICRLLESFGFTIVRSQQAETDIEATPLVFVENEVTYAGEHDDWEDQTGVQYHYPNVGRRFTRE